jgi:hypothetical protein
MANFADLLAACGKDVAPKSLLFFIDGVDVLEDGHNAHALQWIPETIPEVSFVLLIMHVFITRS